MINLRVDWDCDAMYCIIEMWYVAILYNYMSNAILHSHPTLFLFHSYGPL
jgi:hypothetical protein